MILVFLYKHKTAFESRISDWSADVCSSDLSLLSALAAARREELTHSSPPPMSGSSAGYRLGERNEANIGATAGVRNCQRRSEERRVGKEGVSTYRSRWMPDH